MPSKWVLTFDFQLHAARGSSEDCFGLITWVDIRESFIHPWAINNVSRTSSPRASVQSTGYTNTGVFYDNRSAEPAHSCKSMQSSLN
jgi:hypothetical protein